MGQSSELARTIYFAKFPKTTHEIKEVKLFDLQGKKAPEILFVGQWQIYKENFGRAEVLFEYMPL